MTPTPTVLSGDCLDILAGLEPDSVDAIVTDPPYGLGFMGKAWDELPPGREWADACLRVLKPGGHLLAFGGTRTWHRLAVAVEDAGFEIRDSIAWLYGSGFPKSLDVSKAIDKAAGAQREVIGTGRNFGASTAAAGKAAFGDYAGEWNITAPTTPEAERWQGWGTALKPAFEPVVVARKPLSGTVAANVLEHGTGALNIDACRIEGVVPSVPQPVYGVKDDGVTQFGSGVGRNGQMSSAPGGRWPANVVLDGTTAAIVDQQSGFSKSPAVGSVTKTKPRHSGSMAGGFNHDPDGMGNGYGDSGGASRFFYVAKAPKRERPNVDGVQHPTVKPLALMRWLVRLVTPPGGVVLDPFAGSGTTVEAALLEGFDVIGIEREPDYLPLIDARIARTQPAQEMAA